MKKIGNTIKDGKLKPVFECEICKERTLYPKAKHHCKPYLSAQDKHKNGKPTETTTK